MYEVAIFEVIVDAFSYGRTGLISTLGLTFSFNFEKYSIYGFVGDLLTYIYFEKNFAVQDFLSDVRKILD